MFDFVHILKTIRNNWLNLKNENQVFIYPSFEDFYPTYTKFPLTIQKASFNEIRIIYKFEQKNIARMAPRLTTKACRPSKLERQNVKLALRVFHELASAALKIFSESRPDQFKCQISDFIDIVVNFQSSTTFHQSILSWIYIPCSSLHSAYYAELSVWKNMKQIGPAQFLSGGTNHLYLKSSATVPLHSIHYLGSECIIMQAVDRSDRIRATYTPCLL